MVNEKNLEVLGRTFTLRGRPGSYTSSLAALPNPLNDWESPFQHFKMAPVPPT